MCLCLRLCLCLCLCASENQALGLITSQVRTLRVARLVTTTETPTSSRNQKRGSLRHVRQPHPRPLTRAQTSPSTGRQMGILCGVLNLWDVGTLTGKEIQSVAASFMSFIFGLKRRSFIPYRNNQNTMLIERLRVAFTANGKRQVQVEKFSK